MPTLPQRLVTDEHGARIGQEELPPFVQTQAHLDRWRLCVGIAERMTGEHESSQHVWMASRELFHSDIPTEEPSSVMRLQGDSSEEIGLMQEARRRPQRRDRLGRWADMPDVPKPALQRRHIRRQPMPPLSPGVEQLELDAAELTFQPPSEFALSVLRGYEGTHERYMLKRQPAASPGYDPSRHPVYAAHRARQHHAIIGAQLAAPVEALLGGQHPTTAKLRRGELLSEAEKEEVRAAAHRSRGGGSPHALFTAGGPASGKTTLLKANPELKPAFAAEIDPDDIKKELWEFRRLSRAKDQYAARAVHRESGDIAARLYDEATSMGLNVVVDGTGDNPPGDFVAELRRARLAGYKVDLIYVDRPTREAVAFALDRARRGGRFVPIPVVRAQHRAVSRNFRDEVSKLDWVHVDVFDPTGHIAVFDGGRHAIFDEDGYARFIEKAEEHDE